ncbi:MAG: murein biosynthesis integral membrane protein MurJ [Deltaproteobacteria bacterium]|nr:murein biosynthesis integral membrane protein MurJ [Deltaproteobacteria bacterium]
MVTAGIVLSRLVGLVRQRVSAHYFGTSAFADVIAAAFRIGNVVQNLLGEGTLSASFIPVYAKLRAAGRDDEAARFAQSALGLLIAAVLVLSGLGVALAPWVTLLVAPGFEPDKLAVTARLVRIVFPMTGLLVLCAWALGVLNAHRRFFLPYAAPVIWSAAQIAALLVAGSWLGQQGEPLAQALSWGALAGAGVELALLMERARPLVGAIRPRLTLADEWLREAIRRLPGALLGRGVIQLSGLIDTLLVSFLGTGANATFAYAQMLYLLPMSLLGTGEAAASLPEMAGYSADADTERRNALLRRRLGAGLSRTAVLAVPTMVALILLGRETIALLLQTGKFDRSSTERVAAVLAIYGFALLANASGRLFATASFALGDTRGPGRYALVRMVASTAVALALMQPLGVVGVVVGAMSAGWLEAVLLGRRTRRALGGLGLAQVRFGRLGALAAVNAAVPLGVRWLLGWGLGEGFASSPGGSALVLAALAASFAVAAPALGLFELRSLIGRGR